MIGVGNGTYVFSNGRGDKGVDFDKAGDTVFYHLL